MATVAASPADRKASERKFYSRMALFLVAVVFIGFAPSFYLKGMVPPYPRPNPTLPPAVILHGTVFTLWMAVIVAQTQLIAARKHEIHMRLGKLTMLLAILMIPVMYLTAVWQVARANQPPFTDPLTWTAIPLAVIPGFAFLVYEAWRRRREAQWHKRLMLGASILVVAGPGFSRIPLSPPIFWGFALQLLAGILLLFAPLFVWDRRTNGQVHPATWTGFLASLAAAILPLALIYTNSWAGIAAHLPGVGA
jgi:cytochrome bd-type quinol oxidase subunit 2